MLKITICCFLLMLIVVTVEAVDPSLVLYLSLDEGNGDVAKDLSPGLNNAELQDGPDWVNGKFGKALEFDEGSRIWIQVSDSLHGNIFQENFTFLAWIRPTMLGDTWQHVWRSVNANDETQCTLFLNTGGFISWRGRLDGAWGERIASPAGLIVADDWTHVAVVGNDANYIIYINGEEAARVAFEEMEGEITDFYMGFDGRAWDERYSGAIDDVYMLTRAMTEAEIQAATLGVLDSIISVRPLGKFVAMWGSLKL